MVYKIGYNTKREYENKINEFRVQDGISLQQLADTIGSTVGTVQNAANAMISPRKRNGETKRWAKELLRVFNCKFSELFPFEQCEIRRDELTDDQKAEITTSTFTYKSNDMIELRLLRSYIVKVIKTLKDKKERKVIVLRFFKDWSYTEISEHMGYSGPTRICQIEARALRKLRHPSRSKLLRLFIDSNAGTFSILVRELLYSKIYEEEEISAFSANVTYDNIESYSKKVSMVEVNTKLRMLSEGWYKTDVGKLVFTMESESISILEEWKNLKKRKIFTEFIHNITFTEIIQKILDDNYTILYHGKSPPKVPSLFKSEYELFLKVGQTLSIPISYGRTSEWIKGFLLSHAYDIDDEQVKKEISHYDFRISHTSDVFDMRKRMEKMIVRLIHQVKTKRKTSIMNLLL